ncbi:MAG: D-alanyl-D-alanine carboxypeptidase [Clostridia bacterium]|nr:D-alanyl-D-alanine carboxypeptidase [Clostridia bacterium]
MVQKKLFKTTVFLLCILLLFVSLPFASFAEQAPLPSLKEAAAAYLYHIESESLICSKEENTNLGAGSTVKVMAGLLFCEQLAERQNERVAITAKLLQSVPSVAGYSLKIEEGDIFTVRQLLFAAICGSYNDAIYILGAYLYGSVEQCIDQMNLRAVELGANQTSFMDVTGINSGSRTTVADLAKITRVAWQNALYMEICNAKSFYLSTEFFSKTIYNRNALISTQGGAVNKYYNEYCNGMSAGSTSSDGNCVVTVAKHNKETYLCIVLGGQEIDGDEYGYRITNRLIDWVYATYSYVEVISPEIDVCTIPVTVSDFTTEVRVRTKKAFSAYLPRGAEVGKDVTYSIRLNNTVLEAPVDEDCFVGYIAIVYQNKILETLELYTVERAERSSIASGLKWIQSLTEDRAVRAGFIFFILAISAWLITEYLLARRRRHKWDKYFSDKMEISETFLTKDQSPKDKNKRN